MIALRHLRPLALAGSGLVFGGIAVLALAFPHAVAQEYALLPDGVSGMNQFRAVYTGFWAGLGLLMITAARRPDVPVLGDLAGAMILLQALGRALSFALDGVPRPSFVLAFAGELACALVILALRRSGDLQSNQPRTCAAPRGPSSTHAEPSSQRATT